MLSNVGNFEETRSDHAVIDTHIFPPSSGATSLKVRKYVLYVDMVIKYLLILTRSSSGSSDSSEAVSDVNTGF